VSGAEGTRAAHDGCGSARVECLERADRRQHHRQTQIAAERLGGCVDPADVAQHAWPECDLVERHSIAPQRGFGLGAAHDVVPGILIEVSPRLADDLVKVLELVGVRADLSGRRRLVARCVIHGALLPDVGADSCRQRRLI